MIYYPNVVLWWNRNVKQRIRQTFQREGASRNGDRKDMEEFYYTAIYHAPQSTPTSENLAIAIRRLKAKILRLQCKNMRGILLDTDDTDAVPNKDITTYNYTRSRKRSKARTVINIIDHQGQFQTDHGSILHIFKEYIDLKYCNIQSDIRS